MKITEYKNYPWLLVCLFSLLGIFFPAAVTQFSMVVGELSDALGTDSQTVLLADTWRAVLIVLSMLSSGVVCKRLGLRRTLALGMFFQISAQFLVPLAVDLGSLPLFFIFKSMQGLNAVAFPLYISTITEWVSKRYTALATAIFNGSFIAGGGIGAWLAGLIVPAVGWKASFYVVGLLCLVFAVPVLAVTREKPRTLSEDKPSSSAKKSYINVMRNPLTWLMVLSLVANVWISQAVNVDLSVYTSDLGYSYGQRGTLMLVVSAMTVLSSVTAGFVSDALAARSDNRIRTRCIVLMSGYVLSALTAVALPYVAGLSFGAVTLCSSAMMFGASWAGGVFWAIPDEIYSPDDLVSGVAFCSGASGIPNPIAPLVVGVMLGTAGSWNLGWLTCCAVSIVSLISTLAIPRINERKTGRDGGVKKIS